MITKPSTAAQNMIVDRVSLFLWYSSMIPPIAAVAQLASAVRISKTRHPTNIRNLSSYSLYSPLSTPRGGRFPVIVIFRDTEIIVHDTRGVKSYVTRYTSSSESL